MAAIGLPLRQNQESIYATLRACQVWQLPAFLPATTAVQHRKIAILEVDIAKDGYVMCSHYNFIRCNGYDFYIKSGTSQRVNSSKGFNFFKTICKKAYTVPIILYIFG